MDARGDGAQSHTALKMIAREMGRIFLSFACRIMKIIANISAMSEAGLDLTVLRHSKLGRHTSRWTWSLKLLRNRDESVHLSLEHRLRA